MNCAVTCEFHCRAPRGIHSNFPVIRSANVGVELALEAKNGKEKASLSSVNINSQTSVAFFTSLTNTENRTVPSSLRRNAIVYSHSERAFSLEDCNQGELF